MFKLRDIDVPADYTDGDLANALTSVVTYTYGDRSEHTGFYIADIPGEGATPSGSIAVGTAFTTTVPDATMLVTEYSTGKMGVIPCSAEEAQFVSGHAALMAAIATLLGYQDYVVYSFVTPNEGQECWYITDTRGYDMGGQSSQSVKYVAFHDSGGDRVNRGILTASDTPAMFFAISTPSLGSKHAPNGVARWSATQMHVPLEYYIADLQNVQDAARSAVAGNAALANARFETFTADLGQLVGLVGSLSVFGNTVKEVTDRYNGVSQYIPRP